jgi:bacillithiol biosynthesis cysteine-adding enzyme BshC
MSISFLEIETSENKLFRDYLYDFPKVEKFFSVDYQNAETIESHLQKITAIPRDRSKIVEILARQNSFYGNTSHAWDNIQKLKDKNTVAIVTGQQMGIFTGPLYTIYKAIGAVKQCAYYQSRYPDYSFVPVFWMELEDHDFEEVRSIRLLSVENELVRIAYDGHDSANTAKNPVHKILIDSDIVRVLEELRAALNKTDFTEALLQSVHDNYTEGASVADAFGKWMAVLLGKSGLILMDPSDREVKNMVRPIFKRELENASAAHDCLTGQSRALAQAGYEVQVETEGANLFLLDDKNEKAVFNKNGRNKIRLTLEDVHAHAADLHGILEHSPERFIPNVVLRPIVQDSLLPTFAYLGGPSEIAYFAQFKTLYDFYGVTEPMIIPRPFVTLMEKKNKKVLDKYGITLQDIFNDPTGILDRVASRSSRTPVPVLFEDFISHTKQQFSEIEKQISQIDPTLKGAAATALEKISQAIKVLQDKSADAEKRNLELTHSQLAKALNHLYPDSAFQERTLNILYYLNKYGMGIVDVLSDKIDIASHDHQIIEL